MADTRLLQKILLHPSTFDNSVFIEEDLQIFPEATGVVVADGFSVSKCWVGQNGDIWESENNHCQMFNNLFCVCLCLQRQLPLVCWVWLHVLAAVPSSIGLDSRIWCSISCLESPPLTAAKYWRISLVLSVFPAPDSPLKKKEDRRDVIKKANLTAIALLRLRDFVRQLFILTWWCSTGFCDGASC